MSGDGMNDFISAMTTGFSNDALWGAITPLTGLIIGVGLFALGLYFTRRTTKGASKGKLRF